MSGKGWEFLDLLKTLSHQIERKCTKLSELPPDDESLKEQVLELCDKIIKNCVEFKNQLNDGDLNSHNFIINLNLLDIIGHDNCKGLKEGDIDKLKQNLEEFSKGYLTNSRDQVFQELYQLHCPLNLQTNNLNASQNISNKLNGKTIVTEIFGSDTETGSSFNTSSPLSSPKKLKILSDISVRLDDADLSRDSSSKESCSANFKLGTVDATGIAVNEIERRGENVEGQSIQETTCSSDSTKQTSNIQAANDFQDTTKNLNGEKTGEIVDHELVKIREQNKETTRESTNSDSNKEEKSSENLSNKKIQEEVGANGTDSLKENAEESTEQKESASLDVVHPLECESSSANLPESNSEKSVFMSSQSSEENENCAEKMSQKEENSDQIVTDSLPEKALTVNLPQSNSEKVISMCSQKPPGPQETEENDKNRPQQEENADMTVALWMPEKFSTVNPSESNSENSISGLQENEDSAVKRPQREEIADQNVADSSTQKSSTTNFSESNSEKSVSICLQKCSGSKENKDDTSTAEEESEIFSVLDRLIPQGLEKETGLKRKDGDDENEDDGASLESLETGSDSVTDENTSDKCRFMSGIGLAKKSKVDKDITVVRDELEYLLESSTDEDVTAESTSSSDHSEIDYEVKYSETAAKEALRRIDEESSSFLDSLSDYDVNSSDYTDWSDYEVSQKTQGQDKTKWCPEDFVPKEFKVIVERTDLLQLKRKLDGVKRNESEFEIKECSVVLEPLKICDGDSESEEDDFRRKPLDENAEINRLCNLSTLDRKRKNNRQVTTKKKIKRKRRLVPLSGSETSDLTDYSSVSDSQLDREREFKEEDDTPTDPNTLLMEIVCHTIHDSDSDFSSYSSDGDGRDEKREKRKNNYKEKGSQKRDKDGDSWRNDPLLRGTLNLPSERKEKGEMSRKRERTLDTNSDSDFIVPRRKKRNNFFDLDNSEDSTSLSSDDDFVDNKTETTKSVEDSDIEYVGSTAGEVHAKDDKKNRRRKILPVLSTKDLTVTTQRAGEEENERVRNLEEQRSLRTSQETSSEEKRVVLDTSKNGSKILIDYDLSRRLMAHQIEGIRFMWEACYLSIDSLDTFQGTGCILAHNMGLGKTFQVVTLVHTLFNYPITKTKHVVVVCPLSTVPGWKKEFINALNLAKDGKDINVITLESSHQSSMKYELVKRWERVGGVLILGYEAFCTLTNSEQSEEMRRALMDPGPDLIVCDEGHLLKNGRSLRTRSLMEIRTKRRVALTGTPLQNNLNEYYFMVQFVKPNLLGTRREFKRQFTNPIMNGQYEDSQMEDIILMKKRTHVLHRLLKNTVQRYEASELCKYLPKMEDYALFVKLHPVQVNLYNKYIQAIRAKSVNEKTTISSFFNDFQVLKFICSHPQLLQTMDTQNVKKIKEQEVISQEPENVEVDSLPTGWWRSECSEEILTNVEFGTKLQVMIGIIEEAEKKKDKVLIFTSSLVELSSVEFFLKLRGTSSCPSWQPNRDYFRMDGTVPPAVRTKMCDQFNNKSNLTMRVFLMSHKVGGLGLNLVAANRVILLGVHFNPAQDTQSIYRAYRFGQEKKVYIYRLLSMDTMEEKIYNRCVTKLAIASRVIDKHQIARHYKTLDLEDLYNVDINLDKQRPALALPEDDLLSSILLRFKCIHNYHHHQKLLENRPDEELNEEEQKKAWEEFEEMINREKTALPNNKPAAISSLVQQEYMNIMKPENFKKGGVPYMRLDQIPKNILDVFDGSATSIGAPGPSGISTQGTSALSTQNTVSPQTSAPTARVSSDALVKDTFVNQLPQKLKTYNPLLPKLIKIGNSSIAAGARGFSLAGRGSHLSQVGSASQQCQIGRATQLSQTGRGSQLSQAGRGSHQSRHGSGSKHMSSAIGPNPMYKASLQKKTTGPNWRTSSSDDFQSSVGSRKAIPGDRRRDVDQDVIFLSEDTMGGLEGNGMLRGNTNPKASSAKASTLPVIDIT